MKRLMADPAYAPATATGSSDIRSSFRRAVAEATAAGAGDTVSHRPSTDTDDDDDDESSEDDGEDSPAGEGDDEAEDGEDDGDDAAEGESEDEGGEDDADGEDAEPGDEAEDEEAEPETKAADLLSDKEIKAIQRAHPNDPQAQIKAFQASYTKKTQAIAKEAKTYKGLLSYLPLVQAYEENPVQTITRLARMNGMKIVDADGEPALVPGGKGKGKTAASATTEDDTADLMAGILEDFKKELGPELEYMADPLAAAMTKAMTKLAGHTVDKRVKGLEEATVSLTRDTAEAQSDRVMDSFYRAHKDAKDPDFESEMNELAQSLTDDGKGGVRAVGMSEAQFLEFLYDAVKNKRIASTSKESIEKEARRLMKKRLAKLGTARSGERRATATVSDDKISRRPRGAVDIRAAFKAAKAGIRFDDNEDDDE